MRDLTTYGWVALILVLIGGINLLLVGLVRIDLISSLFGVLLGRLLFIIIGAAAIYLCYLIYLDKTKKSDNHL